MVKTKISQCCHAKSPTRAYGKLDSLYIVDGIYFLLPYKRDSDLATLPIVIDTRTTSKFTRHARCQQNVHIDNIDFNDVTIKMTVTINDVIARTRYRLLLHPYINTDINKKWDISFYDTPCELLIWWVTLNTTNRQVHIKLKIIFYYWLSCSQDALLQMKNIRRSPERGKQLNINMYNSQCCLEDMLTINS